MIRESAEDTVLKIPKPLGQEGYTMLPIPKGTLVCTIVSLMTCITEAIVGDFRCDRIR